MSSELSRQSMNEYQNLASERITKTKSDNPTKWIVFVKEKTKEFEAIASLFASRSNAILNERIQKFFLDIAEGRKIFLDVTQREVVEKAISLFEAILEDMIEQESSEVDLTKMTKKELLAYAETQEIEIDDSLKKQEVLEAIRTHMSS